MKQRAILVIDLPTLRLDWLESEMPRLHGLSKGWHRGPIRPVFPALTCPSHATLTTGAAPCGHGVIANGLFDRAGRTSEFWVFPDDVIQKPRIWDQFRAAGLKTGAFFLLNIRNGSADAILLPRPIHHEDGSMEMWCYHKPDGLYPRLVEEMNHFDLRKFWGPMAGIESSQWIGEAAKRTIVEEGLDLSFVYFPHTDYAPQKFGPSSDAYRQGHREIDGVLCDLIEGVSENVKEVSVVILSEYAMTDVNRCLLPNLVLREAGLLSIEMQNGKEHIDFGKSQAFALVDHQIAHIYCGAEKIETVKELFEGEEAIETVLSDLSGYGLDHERSGDVLLIAKRDAWFAYPWWHDSAMAPDFAKTVDIHAKPGYDPLEMFWDPKINGTAQDTSLIKGSHGAPASDPDQQASLLSNLPGIDRVGSTGDVFGALKASLELFNS